MRIFMLPPSLVLSLLLQTAPTIVRALENDFSAYPSGSQQCLYDSADQTPCTGNSGSELNQCLCRNKGNFIVCIYNTATCVAQQSPSDLVAVYETLEYNCNGTGVTIAVSKGAFLAQASAATSSSTPTATATATAAPTSSDAATSSTLSSSAKIAIGAGIGFGFIALGLAGWFVWAYSRRRRAAPPAGATAVPPGSSAGPPWTPNTEYTNSYGMAATSPGTEYAHMNMQQGGAVELPPDHEWKYPVGYPYAARKTNANEPLLAELGEGADQVAPVELPGSMPGEEPQQLHQGQQEQQQGKQGQQQQQQQQDDNDDSGRHSPRYSDQSMGLGPGGDGQRCVSPLDTLSPTGFPQTGGSDVSPYSTYSSHY